MEQTNSDVGWLAAEAGGAKLSKTAKDTKFDTPSTLPKAGAADSIRFAAPGGPVSKLHAEMQDGLKECIFETLWDQF